LITEFIGTWFVNSYVSWILKFTMPLKRAVLEGDSFMKVTWLHKLTRMLSQDTLTRNAAWNHDPRIIEMQSVHGQKFIRDALMTSIRFLICVIIATCCVKEFSIYFMFLTIAIIAIAFLTSRLFYLFFEVMPFFVERYQDAAKRMRDGV
jgi:hypothetical protein